LELLAALTDAVNAVWEKRSELIALTTKKRAPRHLDIWELLPRTNCKQCGEATCMAFAVGLLQNTRELDECLLLMADPSLAERRATLEAMLG
jgi:ArsR family metal-binding transcriptional regulator